MPFTTDDTFMLNSENGRIPPDGVLIEGKVARCVNKEITFTDVWVGLCETVSSFPYICMQSDVRLSKARLSASRDNPKDIPRVLRAGELR